MAKLFTGTVTSTKMQKTVTVLVEWKMRHPFYKKVIKRHKKFKVHYDGMELSEGDRVEFKETRPISKDVHFIVSKKIESK